jgi:hypothetical protein
MFSRQLACALGALGAMISTGAALASGPVNDTCGGALPAPLGTTMGNNCDSFMSLGFCGSAAARGVLWYMFTAPQADKYVIDTFGSQFDTVLFVYDVCNGSVIACNDDTDGLQSRVQISLAAGQSVKIALGSYAEDDLLGGEFDCGDFRLNIAAAAPECCQPWDNGPYDDRNAQTSQIGYDRNWATFARVTADDFWLCEGSVYRIRTLKAVMLTDAIVPKAQVVILPDCDGTPLWPIAAADSQPIDLDTYPVHLHGDCAIGSVEIRELGTTTADGFRLIEVTATFPKLWLKGGSYWVAFVGYSGTSDPEDQFFWGTSGNNVVKGRPGKFYNSDDMSWTDIDLLCCGCTDFNFCVEGEKCKILLDNGVPNTLLLDFAGPGVAPYPPQPMIPGSPSLQNGSRTSDKSRTADDFVVPPCSRLTLCYLEGYILTNCERVRLDIYDGSCHCPSEADPILTLEPQCLTRIGVPAVRDGQFLSLYRAEFFDFKGIRLEPGRNYWVSLYALGDGSQNARGYFLWNVTCGSRCPINFNPGCIKGPPYNTAHWQPVEPARDFAFLVAVADAERDPAVVLPPAPTCAADINGVDGVTVQDLFDFLAAWFGGCP